MSIAQFLKRGIMAAEFGWMIWLHEYRCHISSWQFAARSRDDEVLRVSSSGGVFTELAHVVLAKKGVVVAAGWNHSTMTVEHRCVETEAELADLRGSKYVSSDMSGVYKPMERYVEEGRNVLFVGTPCQVAAMRRRFGSPSNLFLCAIACHSNVPSDVWTLYCQELQRLVGSRIVNVHFRDKSKGWRRSTLCIDFEDKTKNIRESLYENFYTKVFFSGCATRTSCFQCPFRAGHSGADLLIGDFWGIEDAMPILDDGKGVSVVLLYTQLGLDLLRQARLTMHQVSYENSVAKNPFIEVSPKVDTVRRSRFQRVYRARGLRYAMHYSEYGPLPREIVVRAYRLARRIIGRLCRTLR